MTSKKDDSFVIPAQIVLSARSFRKLVKMLEKPPKPTKALRRLMREPLMVNCPPMCQKCFRCHRGKCPRRAQEKKETV